MRNRFVIARAWAMLGVVLPLTFGSTDVLAQDEPTLGAGDYDQWERLGGAVLSPDGTWMAVSINRVSDEGELRIHRTDSDSVVVIPFGTRATFASDGAWLAYSIGISPDARDAAQKADKPVHNSLGLMNLRTGEQEEIEDIQSFSFSDDGAYLVIRRYKPEDKESEGVDVIVRTMATGSLMPFGNVSALAWQDEGHLLALTIDTDGQIGNAVSVFDPTSGRIGSLDTDSATYRGPRGGAGAAGLVPARHPRPRRGLRGRAGGVDPGLCASPGGRRRRDSPREGARLRLRCHGARQRDHRCRQPPD